MKFNWYELYQFNQFKTKLFELIRFIQKQRIVQTFMFSFNLGPKLFLYILYG